MMAGRNVHEHTVHDLPGRGRRHRGVRGRDLQPACLADPGRPVLVVGRRRPAQAAHRSRAQPRRVGQGLCGARARHARCRGESPRRRDGGADPGVARPGRGPAEPGAARALRPRRVVSRSQGERQLPVAPGLSRRDRGLRPERSPLLQRRRARPEHSDPGVPVEPGRRLLPVPLPRVLRARSSGGAASPHSVVRYLVFFRGLLVLAALAALPPRAEGQPPSFAIERFAVTLEVEATATLRVREAITFEFRGAHQGVYRTIPVRYERRGLEFALRVDDIHASDENVKPLATAVSRLGRAIRVKVLVPGATNTIRTVVITYRVRRALIEVDDHEELYWNVTGTEWDVPIRQVEAVVSSPPWIPLDRVTALAYTGPRGIAGTDYTEERADSFLTFRTTRPLKPREGLTIAVG